MVDHVTEQYRPDPEDAGAVDAYAVKAQITACAAPTVPMYEQTSEVEYGVEVARGEVPTHVTDEFGDVVEALPDYRDGAAIVVRTVTYSPWRYITPEEITHA